MSLFMSSCLWEPKPCAQICSQTGKRKWQRCVCLRGRWSGHIVTHVSSAQSLGISWLSRQRSSVELIFLSSQQFYSWRKWSLTPAWWPWTNPAVGFQCCFSNVCQTRDGKYFWSCPLTPVEPVSFCSSKLKYSWKSGCDKLPPRASGRAAGVCSQKR